MFAPSLAQDVQAAFLEERLDPHKYSLFCFDEWGESSEEVETTEDDPDAYAKVIEVQKTELVTVTKRKIEVHEDKAVQIEYPEEVEQPLYKKIPVVDEAGNQVSYLITPETVEIGVEVDSETDFAGPVIKIDDKTFEKIVSPAVYGVMTHEMPVLEQQTKYYKLVTKPAGGLYGIRYEQLLAFVIAAL
ncbi:hypothetical protein [Aeromonas salmonicida]|uniref:hypothetical protein n=1 Tax=Aeromonas salmonicida TaxID=645 RepID=UPI00073B3280|nr:hypothetical protein [Aeromonas salmonicida]KTA79024.1 hypothetical protein VO70_21040 [Aeromonas salmonicida]